MKKRLKKNAENIRHRKNINRDLKISRFVGSMCIVYIATVKIWTSSINRWFRNLILM